MTHSVIVSREKRGLGHSDAYIPVKKAVDEALNAEGVREKCTVCVLFTDDEGIRIINAEQRGLDKATDVLSFPMNDLIEGRPDFSDAERWEDGSVFLGDMVISLPHALAQGEEYGHGFAREISYLAVHSTLHLLGYDHTDEGARKKLMRKREKAIMKALGMEDKE